jgi:hypothetical protein
LLFPAPVHISGIAVDSEGRPIRGVLVEHLAVRNSVSTEEPLVETDADGRFSADTIAPAMVFRKSGFESQFARAPVSQTELRALMKPAPAMEEIPVLPKPKHSVSVGGILCLPKVKGVYAGGIGGSTRSRESSRFGDARN